MSEKIFQNWKTNALNKMKEELDRSRAGGVDLPIRNLVNKLNQKYNLYTTSSCSGRIIIFSNGDASNSSGKGHCIWWLTSHDLCSYADIILAIEKIPDNIEFSIKFEPCIFHIMCQNLDLARNLVEFSRSAGFRNSGITMGLPQKEKAVAASVAEGGENKENSVENSKFKSNKKKAPNQRLDKINVAIRHTLSLEVPFLNREFLLRGFYFIKDRRDASSRV